MKTKDKIKIICAVIFAAILSTIFIVAYEKFPARNMETAKIKDNRLINIVIYESKRFVDFMEINYEKPKIKDLSNLLKKEIIFDKSKIVIQDKLCYDQDQNCDSGSRNVKIFVDKKLLYKDQSEGFESVLEVTTKKYKYIILSSGTRGSMDTSHIKIIYQDKDTNKIMITEPLMQAYDYEIENLATNFLYEDSMGDLLILREGSPYLNIFVSNISLISESVPVLFRMQKNSDEKIEFTPYLGYSDKEYYDLKNLYTDFAKEFDLAINLSLKEIDKYDLINAFVNIPSYLVYQYNLDVLSGLSKAEAKYRFETYYYKLRSIYDLKVLDDKTGKLNNFIFPTLDYASYH